MKNTLSSDEPELQPGMVGIFWLVKNRLLMRASSLDEAEAYGECLVHGQSHIRCWEALKHTGEVSQDSEYDDFPRGRVTFNTREELFYLFADNCIRRSSTRIARIIRFMHLQSNTVVASDLHYRCPKCLQIGNPLD